MKMYSSDALIALNRYTDGSRGVTKLMHLVAILSDPGYVAFLKLGDLADQTRSLEVVIICAFDLSVENLGKHSQNKPKPRY